MLSSNHCVLHPFILLSVFFIIAFNLNLTFVLKSSHYLRFHFNYTPNKYLEISKFSQGKNIHFLFIPVSLFTDFLVKYQYADFEPTPILNSKRL